MVSEIIVKDAYRSCVWCACEENPIYKYTWSYMNAFLFMYSAAICPSLPATLINGSNGGRTPRKYSSTSSWPRTTFPSTLLSFHVHYLVLTATTLCSTTSAQLVGFLVYHNNYYSKIMGKHFNHIIIIYIILAKLDLVNHKYVKSLCMHASLVNLRPGKTHTNTQHTHTHSVWLFSGRRCFRLPPNWVLTEHTE